MSAPRTASRSATRDWWLLAAMCVPLLTQSLDVSGVGLLLPSVGRDLGAGPTALAWVMNANALAFGALLLTFGKLADRHGPRTLLLGGIAGFGLSSVACGLAPTTATLVLARGLQGAASAACFTTSLTVVMATFDRRRRATAIGIWGAVAGAGGALGPLVAGALTTGLGWRSFFLVNGPLCLVALPLAAVLVHVPADPPPTTRMPTLRLVLLATAFVAVTLAASHAGGSLWLRLVTTAVPLAVAAVAAAVVVVARRRGSPPVLAPGTLDGRWSRAALAVAVTSTWGFGVTLVLISAYLQQVLAVDPLEAGLVFVAFSGAYALAGSLNGTLVHALGLTRTLVAAMALCVVGFALLLGIDTTTSVTTVTVALVVEGLGQGLAFAASTTASLAGVPEDAAGEATGTTQTLRLLGNVVGVAASTGLLVDVRGGSEAAAALARGDRAAMALALVVSLVGLVSVPLLVRGEDPGPTGSVGGVTTSTGRPTGA